jgi:hypothetical protein
MKLPMKIGLYIKHPRSRREASIDSVNGIHKKKAMELINYVDFKTPIDTVSGIQKRSYVESIDIGCK